MKKCNKKLTKTTLDPISIPVEHLIKHPFYLIHYCHIGQLLGGEKDSLYINQHNSLSWTLYR